MHCTRCPPASILPAVHSVQPLNKAPSLLLSLDKHTGQHNRINAGDEDKDQTALETSWWRGVNNRPPQRRGKENSNHTEMHQSLKLLTIMAKGERFVSNQAKLRKRTSMHAPILFLKVKNCLINSSAKRRWALSGVPLQRIALDFSHLAPNCFNSHHMAKTQAEALKVYPLVFLSIHCCQVANVEQQEGLWYLLLYWPVLEYAWEFALLLQVSLTGGGKAKQERVKGERERERKWKKLHFTLALLMCW